MPGRAAPGTGTSSPRATSLRERSNSAPPARRSADPSAYRGPASWRVTRARSAGQPAVAVDVSAVGTASPAAVRGLHQLLSTPQGLSRAVSLAMTGAITALRTPPTAAPAAPAASSRTGAAAPAASSRTGAAAAAGPPVRDGAEGLAAALQAELDAAHPVSAAEDPQVAALLRNVGAAAVGVHDRTWTGAYMHPAHAVKFLHFAVTERVYVGARRTGTDSIIRICEGFGCKPHTILGKSLKSKSVDPPRQEFARLDLVTLLETNRVRSVRLSPPDNQADTLFTVGPPGAPSAGPGKALAEAHLVTRAFTAVTTTTGGFDSLLDAGGTPAGDVFPYRLTLDVLPEGSDAPVAAAKAQAIALADRVSAAFESAMDAKWRGYVGFWCTLEVTLVSGLPVTIGVPLGVLRVGVTAAHGHAPRAGVPFLFCPDGVPLPADGYTGDYDLNCVYREYLRDGKLVISPPVLAFSASALAHYEVEAHDPAAHPWGPKEDLLKGTALARPLEGQLQIWIDRLNHLCQRSRHVDPGGGAPLQLKPDRYAQVLQHGPQSLYERFVQIQRSANPVVIGAADSPRCSAADQVAAKHLSENPFTALMEADNDGVLAFTPAGEVAILQTRPEVLAFYRRHDIVQSAWTEGHGEAVGALTQLRLQAQPPDFLQTGPVLEREAAWDVAFQAALKLCQDAAAKGLTIKGGAPKEVPVPKAAIRAHLALTRQVGGRNARLEHTTILITGARPAGFPEYGTADGHKYWLPAGESGLVDLQAAIDGVASESALLVAVSARGVMDFGAAGWVPLPGAAP